MNSFKRFFLSRPGKMVAYVVMADALISMPQLFAWAVAAFLVYRAFGELRAIGGPKTASVTFGSTPSRR